VVRGANSVASGAVNTNGCRNSLTAFTGGTARLGFTQAGGAPTPVPETAWAYTDYAYDPNHPHAASALSTGERYQYDANGNMTQRLEGGVTYTQTFDAENRLSTVTTITGTTTFKYDGDGTLVQRVRPDGTSTVYVGGSYEVELNAGGSATTHTSYYSALTARVMRVESTVYYVLTDQLGSASLTLNANGALVGTARYYAFGETRLATGSMGTDKLYTGQRQVAEIGGLYNYNARFYDPYLKRFVSADTFVPKAGNPQVLNRYSYALNSPLRYMDPSGHMVSDDPHWANAFEQAHGYSPTAQDKIDADFAETHSGSGSNGQWTGADWTTYTQIKNAVGEASKKLQANGGGDDSGSTWWSPFSYDTLNVKLSGFGKALLGANIGFSANINMKALRELDFGNVDMSLNADGTVSGGASAEYAAGITVTGQDGAVLDQPGVNVIMVKGVPINIGGCLDVCVAASSTINPHATNGISTSAAWTIGVGEGVDLSVDLLQVSDYALYAHPTPNGSTTRWQVPFFNGPFWNYHP
jgi:RHS repeat-associated protein